LANTQEVMKAYNLFMQLPNEYQAKIQNENILFKLKDRIDQIEKEINDINEDIWWNLPPNINDINLEDKDAILDIIARYEALSDEDKKYVEFYDEVIAAMEKIEE